MLRLLLTRTILVLCWSVLSTSLPVYAQQVRIAAPEPIITPPTNVKCRVGTVFTTINLDVSFAFRTSSDAQGVVEAALRAAGGLSGSVTAKAAQVANAEACLASDSNYYILFNPRWFVRLYNDGDEYWADRAIIAHELGHIWFNHFIKSWGSTQQIELEADEFAGQVLAKLGADLDQAKAPFRSERLRPPHNTDSHPPLNQRLAAVEKGWRFVRGSNVTANDWTPGTPHPTAPHVVRSSQNGKWIPVQGYTFLNDTAGDLRVRWDPRKAHPSAPHVLTCDEEGKWCRSPGYDWVTSASNDLRVVWKPGKAHPTASNISACPQEGRWCLDPGYTWVTSAEDDLQVRWSPGKSYPSLPNVVASDQERNWRPGPGYKWLNDVNTDLRVQWSPGKPHPTAANVIACSQEGHWCCEPGYDWVNRDDKDDLRTRRSTP